VLSAKSPVQAVSPFNRWTPRSKCVPSPPTRAWSDSGSVGAGVLVMVLEIIVPMNSSEVVGFTDTFKRNEKYTEPDEALLVMLRKYQRLLVPAFDICK
jgi:hypothetical protein